MIRAGYEAADVQMWQALCQQAKCDTGNSHEHLYLLLDMANHNKCHVLDVVKTGRVSSNQKHINETFIASLMAAVDDDDDDEVHISKPSTQILDLTCHEVLSESGSYEEEYNDNPTSNEAYEIDGFVVPDHISLSGDDDDDDKPSPSRKLKRKISEDD